MPLTLIVDASAVRQGYVAGATDITRAMSAGRPPRDKIFINVVDPVDRAWNFSGKGLKNAEMSAAVAAGWRTMGMVPPAPGIRRRFGRPPALQRLHSEQGDEAVHKGRPTKWREQ